MVNDLSVLKDLPAGVYTISLHVFERDKAKRLYLYAEDDTDPKNTHMIGFDEFCKHGDAPWAPVPPEKKTRPAVRPPKLKREVLST